MLLARVRRTLSERGLIEDGARVLVACSGGPDSAALLHVLSRLAPERRLTLFAASVNHGLRPDADRDVAAARQLADRVGVPFAALAVEIFSEGASTQAKARAARYEALRGEAARLGAARIAVGHTRDDQAETVLSRLLRGAGVAGLSGIEPAREDGVIRPLVDCPRAAVHAYVDRYELPRVADPSNADPRFERVRLRATVLPALEAEDPRIVEHLASLADEARALRAMVVTLGGMLLDDARTDGGLDVARLSAAPAPVRDRALAAWVEAETGSPARRAHVEALARLLRSGQGEVLLPTDRVVCCQGATLAVRRDPAHPTRSRSMGRPDGSPPAGGWRSSPKASDR